LRTTDVALVAGMSALAVATDFALSDIPNVKLVDPIVFSVAFVFGFGIGASVGIVSEVIWGVVSPYGFGGYIIPFLVLGEIIYALAGWTASKVWGKEKSRLSARNVYLGALLCLSAFAWDLETNAGTALLLYWPSLTWPLLALTEAEGVPFMLAHELSDLVTGTLLVPLIIFYVSRVAKRQPPRRSSPDSDEQVAKVRDLVPVPDDVRTDASVKHLYGPE